MPGPGIAINTERFLKDQKTYVSGGYEQFLKFGGPCVYFHRECLKAGKADFLSKRHVEMLYATLAAWGMHRMGDARTTKTRLTDWDRFLGSLTKHTEALRSFGRLRLLEISESEYSSAIIALRPYYEDFDLSEADATIVANSKALHHLFPEFIPPIDRQHTIRFFQQTPEQWLDTNGKFKLIQLPPVRDAQFELFHSICVEMKRLADRVDASLFQEERRRHDVTPPKALDNAIVNYVRIIRSSLPATTRRLRAQRERLFL